VTSIQNYYPFGMDQPNRTWNANGKYRYGFNGKEKDDNGEWGSAVYDYGFRIYNPSIGKFLSVDPLTKEYPELTPYQFASNTPIQAIDLDGLEAKKVFADFAKWFGYDLSVDQDHADDLKEEIQNQSKNAYQRVKLEVIKERLETVLEAEQTVIDILPGGWSVNATIDQQRGKEVGADVAVNATLEFVPLGKLGKYAAKSLKYSDEIASVVNKFNPCGCFDGKTPILTDSGYVEIKDIGVGDLVWAYNEETGVKQLKKVLRTFKYQRDTLYYVQVASEIVNVTSDHPFFVRGKWVNVRNIRPGDELTIYSGKNSIVESITFKVGKFFVYNFIVEDFHTYYVTQFNILVHNGGPCDFGFTWQKYKTVMTDVLTKGIHGDIFHKSKKIGEIGFELSEDGTKVIFNIVGKPDKEKAKLLEQYGKEALKDSNFIPSLLERVESAISSGQLKGTNREKKLNRLYEFLQKAQKDIKK
ncbi:polymorphic toxin-type HINT domain-containing protein, partial [Chryseosolibacter indicus]